MDELIYIENWQPGLVDASLLDVITSDGFPSRADSIPLPPFPWDIVLTPYAFAVDVVTDETIINSGFADYSTRELPGIPHEIIDFLGLPHYARRIDETTILVQQTVSDGVPFLGGFAITSARWIGPNALKVTFSTTYGTSYQYQLYAGRTLIGQTTREDERSIVAQWQPGNWPDHITLLAVDPDQVGTDYGSKLPDRPYNRVRIVFQGQDSPDVAQYEVHAGTEVGGAVSATNIIGRSLHDRGRDDYEILTEPLQGSGSWNLELRARDNRLPNGNLGTAHAFSADVIAYPPDLTRDRNGDRFTLTVSGGVLTATVQ